MATSLYTRRLGPHHFAHLRAVAEGISPLDAARHFLALDHGHQAITAHRLVVDQARAAARRHGEKDARLIGITIRLANSKNPTLDEFAAERDLDGWSEAEIREMYLEAYGPEPKAARRERLRKRQFELLQKVEALVAQTPKPTDFVGGWFDETLARKLVTAGFTTIGELNSAISAGGAWFKTLPAIGRTKAARIEGFLRTLLPREAVALPFFSLETSPAATSTPGVCTVHHPPALPSHATIRTLPGLPGSLLGEVSLDKAVTDWIDAKAGSEATRKVYAREVGRFLVWLRYERPGVNPARLSVADATAFRDFLGEIPERYISNRKASPGEIGWAPFRGQLTPSSRKQSLIVVSAWLDWMVDARHISANPFRLINKKQGDNPAGRGEIKAFSEGAMEEILRFIDGQAPSPALARLRFLMAFGEAMGLRASELIEARIGHLVTLPEGLGLHVHGKGSKNRDVTLNRQAREALNIYLAARGLPNMFEAAPETPLLASVQDPMEPIRYPTLYDTVRRWLGKAVAAAALPMHEKNRLHQASTHWLRHTFGTRLIEKGAAPDAVQSSMGHASPNTTARYTRTSAKRQFSEVARVFGE